VIESDDPLIRMMASETDRGFGDLILKNRLAHESPFDRPLWDAADNLLTKAFRGLQSGDDARFERFVQRALALGWDEFDEANAALWHAHMMIFRALTDVVESVDEGDHRWLDAVLGVLDRSTDAVRAPLLRTLDSVLTDYRLEPAETRAIKKAKARYPDPGPEPAYRADLPAAEGAQVLRDTLQTLLSLSRSFAEAGLEID
jgi:hypothetical protein